MYLLGENAWGKSSLLDALTLLLAPHTELYCFTPDDFWFPPGQRQGSEHYLHIIFTFRESHVDQHLSPRYQPLSGGWVPGSDGYARLFYRQEGVMHQQNRVMTLRSFIDERVKALALADVDELGYHLIRLHPVLRLRDARFMRCIQHSTVPSVPGVDVTVREMGILARDLVAHPQHLAEAQIRQRLSAMVQLLEHYFSEQGTCRDRQRTQRRRTHDEQRSWRYLDTINRIIGKPGGHNHHLVLLSLFSTLLRAKGAVCLDRDARSLLLVEDPETRLHPIMLSVAWNELPLQKITTTNSGNLLSMTPVEQVCRLVRESSKVTAWRLGADSLNTEERRRIAFHIRTHRPSSLFARFWLLVEGETEVWMMNELARQCGHHFDAEGISAIEFAQSGLRPLVKFARRMGIEWHALVDGDEGKKYAATLRGLLNHNNHYEREHLTVLPVLDMEHFMFQ